MRGGTDFSASPGRQELIDAIANRAVAGGYLIGTYERVQRVPLESPDQENPRELMAADGPSIA